MTKKGKLLEEGQVRQFMKLANLTLSEERLQEMGLDDEEVMSEEESLEEDGEQLEESEGVGPNREGAGKDGVQQGIARNQGKEAKSTPDGKVDHSHPDHKMKDQKVTKKDIESGTPLVEGDLGGFPEEEDELEDEGPGDEMGGEMGGEELPTTEPDMGEPLDGPPGDMGAPAGGGDLATQLLTAIAQAVAEVTGMEIEVNDSAAGGEMEMGGDDELEMEPEGPPMDGAPPAPEGDSMDFDDVATSDEDEVMQETDLTSVKTEALQAELDERKRVAESGEMTAEQRVEQIAESIAKRLFAKKKRK